MKTEEKNFSPKKTEILIAEDSLTQAIQIKHLLESNNYKVSVTQNGKQALDRLAKHRPSLVISDILMPEMNGYDMCKIIKSNRSTEDIPVILLTRLFDPEEIIEGLSCGADSFITKPYNEEYLLSHIEEILSEEPEADQKKVLFGAQILFKGKKRYIQAEQQNVIKLLLNIYEGAIRQNDKLIQTKDELRLLNERLESIVEDRTSDLSEEIKLSNQIADKLKNSEEKWRTLVTTIPDYIALHDPEARFVFLNHYAEGFSENDTIGKSLFDFLSEESKEVYRKNFEKCLGTGKNQKFEYTAFGDNKEIRNYESSLIPFMEKGKASYVMAIARDITERKQAEEELAMEKYLIHSLMDNLPDHIYFKDRSSRFIRINKAQAQFLGLDNAAQAVGMKDSDFFTDEHAQQSYEDEQKIIRTGQPMIMEEKETHLNLPVTWVSSIKVPLRNREGNIIGTFGISRDITERKLAEEAFQESQHLFQTLAQVSPVGIFRTNPDGYTTYVNPKYSELTGLSLEEIMGRGWLKAVHTDDEKELKEQWLSDFKSRKTSSAEYRFLRPDGSIVWVMGNAVPEWIDNEIVGYIGTITDITESKQVEIALQKSEEKYRRIFENVQDLYYETSVEGTILEISPSIGILSRGQYQMDDLIGKSMFDLLSEPEERQALLAAFQEKGAVSDFEITLKNRDGSHIPCSISAKITYDAEGLPKKIIGSMHDISDRRKVSETLKLEKEKAEASDKLKTSFLNNISHEVRTPLNGILGFAEIMSETDLSEEVKKDSLLMLHESTNRLLNTITNYMDISLLSSGNMAVHKKDFLTGPMLTKLFDNYNIFCLNRHIEMFLKIPEQPRNISVNSDPELLFKILSHLLDNAINFTEKGSINFGYIIHEGELEFFVKDTGIGIAKESINLIFDNFVKEERDRSRRSEGSGLGLSIAKGMVECIGGDIHLESEIGAGSCFSFRIPLIKDTETAKSDKSVVNQKTIISGSSILLAEDDETNFEYINAILTQATGATILHASNGLEAVELFKDNPGTVLVLMDVKMPVMNGLEASGQIKAINRNVPVIALTAFAMTGDEDRILKAGCDGYLSKPISKKSLLDKIAEYITI